MKTKIKIVPIFLILFLLSQSSSAQDWFPLDVGNRWDYSVRYLNHGGTYTYDTIFVEIIDEVVLNNKKYYNCSNPLFFGGERLFVENDSLYIYDSMDSTDCLVFAFNLSDSTGYKPCLFDTAIVIEYSVFNIFGYEDTTQIQVTSDIYEFSKKFGFKFKARYNTLYEIEHQLSGCIISGVTYGELLVSVENETESPKEFSLSQNYPNPFNPSTKIQFTIPTSPLNPSPYQGEGNRERLITLKVYDVLGNEVATLVNQEKPTGSYEVEFNSHSGSVRNLPSGIYFYQLKTSSFVETKKMVLLK